jgi:hypothetical protein
MLNNELVKATNLRKDIQRLHEQLGLVEMINILQDIPTVHPSELIEACAGRIIHLTQELADTKQQLQNVLNQISKYTESTDIIDPITSIWNNKSLHTSVSISSRENANNIKPVNLSQSFDISMKPTLTLSNVCVTILTLL